MSRSSKGWGASLRENGHELVLGSIENDWLFLWIVDVEENHLRHRVSMPLMGATFSWIGYYRAMVDRDLFRLITDEEVIEISMTDWRIVRWRPFRSLVPEDSILEKVSILPGSRYMWIVCSRPFGCFIVDLETWSVIRSLTEEQDDCLGFISGALEPLYFFYDSDLGRVYRADGSLMPGCCLPNEQGIWSIAAAPSGEGLVGMRLALGVRDFYESYDDLQWLHLDTRVAKIVSTMSRKVSEDMVESGVHEVTLSREAETIFSLVELSGRHRHRFLYGVALTKSGFRTRYRVKVPFGTVLVQGPRGQRVVALFSRGEGLGVRVLGKTRPKELEHLAEHVYEDRHLRLPRLEIEKNDGPSALGGSEIFSMMEEWKTMSPAWWRVALNRDKKRFRADASKLVTLYCALAWMTFFREPKREVERKIQCEEVLELLKSEHTDHPLAALTVASGEAFAGRWENVDPWLDKATAGELEESQREYLHRLRVLALLHAKNPRAAHALLLEDITRGSWWKSGLREWTEPMAEPPEPGEWSSERSLMRQVLGAILATNRAFATGDLAEVVTLLDRPALWQVLEVETAARRAVAALAAPEETATERWMKRFALARFCGAFENDRSQRARLPGFTWEEAEIRLTEKRSRAWLETS